VRGQLASSRLLDVLEGWLQQARREKQVTVMKQLLQVRQDFAVCGVNTVVSDPRAVR
jgi:hypothetical protein